VPHPTYRPRRKTAVRPSLAVLGAIWRGPSVASGKSPGRYRTMFAIYVYGYFVGMYRSAETAYAVYHHECKRHGKENVRIHGR
jgi:hypothetical protein